MRQRSDQELRQDIENLLAWEPELDAGGIAVGVRDGVVTLAGRARGARDASDAENIAASVEGVRAVENALEWGLQEGLVDRRIAEAAARTLALSHLVPLERIRVRVRGGRLTLRGDVDWHFQRRAARRAVERLWGVRAVRDEIEVVTAGGRAERHLDAPAPPARRRTGLLAA